MENIFFQISDYLYVSTEGIYFLKKIFFMIFLNFKIFWSPSGLFQAQLGGCIFKKGKRIVLVYE